MKDFLIIAAVVLVLGAIIFFVVKNKGKSGCCGSGGYTPKRKKLQNVLYTKTFTVDGMHCDHCKGRVEEVINDMKGLSGRVELKSKTLTVSYAEEVDDSIIIARIEKVGYKVIGVK